MLPFAGAAQHELQQTQNPLPLLPQNRDNISTMRHLELNHLQQLAQELYFNFKKFNTFHKQVLLVITTGKIHSVISFQIYYPKKTPQTSNNTDWESMPETNVDFLHR